MAQNQDEELQYVKIKVRLIWHPQILPKEYVPILGKEQSIVLVVTDGDKRAERNHANECRPQHYPINFTYKLQLFGREDMQSNFPFFSADSSCRSHHFYHLLQQTQNTDSTRR